MSVHPTSRSRQHVTKTEAVGKTGMVTAMHPLAADAGIEILQKGGGAADAAVATALAVGVAEPFMSGLGGCAYAVSYDAKSGETTCFDGSARAPMEAHEGMFELSQREEPRLGVYGWRATKDDASETGHRSVAVPGALKALKRLHESSGTLPWAELVAPAIRLAEEGVPVDEYFFVQSAASASRLRAFAETAAVFLHDDGTAKVPSLHGPAPERLRQTDLARSLRLLAEDGPDSFYSGAMAREIVSCVRRGGGVLNLDDLSSYEARVLPPLEIPYRHARLALLPDGSGGPTVAAALTCLEDAGLSALAHDSVTRLHLVIEALRTAFAERFRTRTTGDRESQHTTHLNVADREGNMVALTATLGARFGSGVTVPGLGVVLNNGFMWFDPEPGRVNSIAPGKPALHAAAPCLLFENEAPRAAVGAPGARKIMSAVLQVLLCLVDQKMGIQDAVAAPRIHSELAPGVLVDARFPEVVSRGLRSRGHELTTVEDGFLSSYFGRPSGIVLDAETSELRGGVEPHRASVAVGY